jgi:hypothetical protein
MRDIKCSRELVDILDRYYKKEKEIKEEKLRVTIKELNDKVDRIREGVKGGEREGIKEGLYRIKEGLKGVIRVNMMREEIYERGVYEGLIEIYRKMQEEMERERERIKGERGMRIMRVRREDGCRDVEEMRVIIGRV